jgi:GT2 family glycosyltransferase
METPASGNSRDAHTPAPKPSVTIIILTWNALDYTKSCLESLRAHSDHPDYRVIVADNGSTDGTIAYLQSLPWVKVLLNGENLGFAAGNNRAIHLADPASDVVLLNNDTEIHQADWLARLQACAYASPDIGVVGCRLRRPGRTFQHAGAFMPLDTLWGQQIGGGEKDINQYHLDRDVESVVFACVYLKREVLEKVGCLDEDYFSYFEDTDFCMRARRGGYRIVCCGSVTVVHHENVSTQANASSHNDMFLRAQKVFRKKWEKTLQAERYTHQLGWHSIFNFPTGYAISSRELAQALDRQGVRLSYKYAYGPGTVFPREEPEQSESYIINMIRARKLRPGGIQVVYGQGDVFQSNFGRYKIGFTMLETDRIPAEWVRQANLMDEVWAPSQFNARTFRDSGVVRPIHVIPLGVDPDYFHPEIEHHKLDGVFSFLSIFEWGERKAPELLLSAFNNEFRANEPVILICKALNVDPGVDVAQHIANLGLDPNGGQIHFSLNQVVPTYQLGCLYRSADCFVLTTRGEGWGMPVIEAMACGLPVIATDWSAHCDFMDAENAYPLPIERLVPAQAKCPYYAGFRWAEPSYQHLRRLMRHVFENQQEARAKGEKASADVRSRWTWNDAAQKIVARLDQINAASDGATGRSGPINRVTVNST